MDGAPPDSRRAARKAERRAKRQLLRQQRIVEQRAAEKPAGPRKWRMGSLTFYYRRPQDEPVVEDVPLTAEVLHSAFLSGRVVNSTPDGSGYSETYAGAVYRNDGTIMPEFLEHERLQAGHRGARMQNPPVVDTARMTAARTIDDRCVYLGDLRRHFGHFLLETLARAWYLKDCQPGLVPVFHGGFREPTDFGPFALIVFGALGIDPSRIVVAHNDLRVRELVLPSAQYLNTVKGSPGMCVVFDHIRESLSKFHPRHGPTPDKVYFTRRNLAPLSIGGAQRRGFVNEDEVEMVFRRRGFEIVSPENLPFEEQVAIAANATHMAGLSGAALHLILFNDRPGTRLIELRTKPAFNQMIVNAIRGVDAFHVWCVADRASRLAIRLDIEAIERAMREIQ